METEKPKIKDDKKVERSNKSKSCKRGPKITGKGNNLGTNSIKKKNPIRAKSEGGLYNKTLTERNYEKIERILSEQDVRKIVIEESKNIYYQVAKKLKINGRNFKDKVLAMYYIASNNLTMPKSFKEIEQMFNIPEAKIKKEYNRIKKLVKIELTVEQQNEILKSYIRTFCDENKENFEYKILAIQIAKNINESSILEGKNTNTITGLSLYIAMKLEKTNSVNKTKICEGRVSESTLNNAYKKIKDYFDIIIPENYKDKIKILL